MEEQKYCISARNRRTNFTESITGPLTKEGAGLWKPNTNYKRLYVYFRVSKYPFKAHKK